MKFFLLLLFPIIGQAFTMNNNAEAYFESDVIKVDVANFSCGTISPQEIAASVSAAVDGYWNRVPTSRLKLELSGVKNVSSVFNTDRMCTNDTTSSSACTINTALKVESGILVACNTDTSNSNFNSNGSTLGKTIPNHVSGNKFLGSLILLNANSNSLQSLSSDELTAVLAHEIGHAIGLGHSPFKDSLMYFRSLPDMRSLGWDDIQAVTYLYPTVQPFGSGCGMIQEISNGPGPGGPLFQTLAVLLMVMYARKSFFLPRP